MQRVYICMCVCFLSARPVKRAAGDKGLQRKSSANECKLLWQPRRVTPSVCALTACLNQLHFLLSLLSTLSVSMAIYTLPNLPLSLSIAPSSSLFYSLVFHSRLLHHPYSSQCVSIFLEPINSSEEGTKTSQNYLSICLYYITFNHYLTDQVIIRNTLHLLLLL